MKLFPLAFSVSLLAASAAMAQSAPVPSWYLALGASVNFVEDAEYAETGGLSPIRGDVSLKDGYGISGAVGYRPRNTGTLADNLRFEAEIATRSNETDTFTSSTTGVTTLTDDLIADTAMVNLYLDMNVSSNWRPYIGGGIGAARVTLESTDLSVDDDDVVFAYQGMAGIYYTPSSFPAADFGVGYRYLGTADPSFTSTTFSSTVDTEYQSHSLELGSRFYF